MSDRPVQLILDTTAILTYPGDGVGETIAEASDAGFSFGLPEVCLAEAVRRGADDRRLDLLVGHEACVVLDDMGDWRAVGTLAQVLGRLDLAVARIAASRHDGYVLSAEPDVYGDGDDGGMPVIGV